MLENIGLISYSANFLGYLVLIVLLAISRRKGGIFGVYLILAVAFELLWSALLSYKEYSSEFSHANVFSIEIIRFAVWNIFLLKILEMGGIVKRYPAIYRVLFFFLASAAVLAVLVPILPNSFFLLADQRYFFILALLLTVVGIVLIEQLYRNIQPENRWKVKLLCIGTGVLFAYDFYVFADALLMNEIDSVLWDARGIVNLLVVPVLAITVSRLPDLSFDLFISRHAVFFTSGLLATGGYLLIMAMGGYYIRIYGGSWGAIAQIAFLIAAGMVLLSVFMSSYTRGKIKQFISKHFYKNKYDYREEWMRLIHNVYEYQTPEYFKEKIIQTVAGLIQCRGGLLFLQSDDVYECDASWNATTKCANIDSDSSLLLYINRTESVIDLHEYYQDRNKYPDLDLPECIVKIQSAWLIIPLKLHYRLVGFLLLLESPIQEYINWEDRELFKAAGRQISSYLAFLQTSAELAEAQQFSAFNRLSAYLVHDLKNLVSQLELITINAAKHKNDPAFIDDAFLTVQNVVAKTKRMLGQLRKFHFDTTNNKRINVAELLKKVVARKSSSMPIPVFNNDRDDFFVNVEPERFENIIEHLIQNAQDATPEDGIVELSMSKELDYIVIKVRDTGCGMDQHFIRERLFKPFDTTKGNAGMGIGVFEAREFVKYHGGVIEVVSEQGSGTTFYIKLPESKEEYH